MSFVELFLLIFMFFSSTNAKKADKIVNGSPVRRQDHAFRVSIQWQSRHHCSGTIISQRHILTTSSCVLHSDGVLYGNLRILSGTIYAQDDYGHGLYHEVCYVIHHAEYNSKQNWIHDIAILLVTVPIPFSVDRQIVPAITPEFTLTPRSRLSIAGWEGNIRYRVPSHRFLRKITVVSKLREQCLHYYQNLDINQECGESDSKDSYVSEGDGGSAIISYKRFFGIVSAIPDNPKDPFIFLKVFGYKDWMNEMMKKY